jgi:hypothetical protein
MLIDLDMCDVILLQLAARLAASDPYFITTRDEFQRLDSMLTSKLNANNNDSRLRNDK